MGIINGNKYLKICEENLIKEDPISIQEMYKEELVLEAHYAVCMAKGKNTTKKNTVVVNIYPETDTRTANHASRRIKISKYDGDISAGNRKNEYSVYFSKNGILTIKGGEFGNVGREFKHGVNVFGKYNDEVIEFSKLAIPIANDCFKNGLSPDEAIRMVANDISDVDIYDKNGLIEVK